MRYHHPVTGSSSKNETKRNETKRNETKRNETKRNETKRNETKRNETKRNETKRNETKRNETKRNETNKQTKQTKQTNKQTNTLAIWLKSPCPARWLEPKWAVLKPFVSSGCTEFCLHKMSDGSVDPACVMNGFRYSVPDGRVVELDVPTRADWTEQHPDGLVGTRVSLAMPAATAMYVDMEDNGQGAIVPSAAQGDDAEGFDVGMAIDGASHHDSLTAVLGSEGSVKGAGAFPVNRADRCPSYRMHVSRHDRSDDMMDHGAVQTREIFELANEAEFEECIHQLVSVGAVPTACGVANRGGVRCRDRHRGEGERDGDGGRIGGVDPAGHRYERRSLSRSAS